MTIDKPIEESNSEDLSLMESDIPSLFKKFIEPIDKIRSYAQPSLSQPQNKSNDPNFSSIKNDFSDLKVDSFKAIESRAHAFYRMLGFPVVGSASSFYSPGFDPAGAKNETKKQKIINSYNSNLKDILPLVQIREQKSIEKKDLFFKQDIESSIYTLLLKYHLPFNIMDSGKGPFQNDLQTFTVSDRQLEITFLSNFNDSIKDKINDYGNKYKTGQKILKPFIVDPRIENTVTPDTNKVCVPFLKDKKSTAIYSNTFLQRPGLELIIRQRLYNTAEDKAFLKDIENIINEQKSAGIETESLDLQTLVDTLSALSDKNSISQTTRDIFKGFTDLQATTVTGLIKTIKVLVKTLVESIFIIDSARSKINWIPIPSQDGPSTGAIGASLSRVGLKNAQSEIDVRITELRIKKLNAERQTKQIDDLGEFASPFKNNSNLENTNKYDEQLNELIEKRDKIAKDAFDAMGNIEMIVGEVAGLGLIDVLAIYTTLWSLDLETLIGFLDDDAFDRLYTNNKDFQGIQAVSNRKNGNTVSIETVLTKFQTTLQNILSFSDKLFDTYLQAPYQNVPGDV